LPPKKSESEARADSSPDPSSAREISRGFAKSFSPENSFRKTESALKPRHTARILGGQNPERKTPFPFSEKNGRAQNQKCKECFLFRGCRAERGSGGAFIIHEFLIK
jgi:hypothetical protein